MAPRSLKSGVCHLSGITRTGTPIVYFTSPTNAKYLPEDPGEFVTQLVALVTYYNAVANEIHGTEKLCVIINSPGLEGKVFLNLIQVLNEFHHSMPQVIQNVYVFELQKLPTPHKIRMPVSIPGIRKKKRNSDIAHLTDFPCLVIHESSDLYKIVDPEQLACDIHGRLSMKLHAWMYIWNMVETLKSVCSSVEVNTPTFIQRIEEKSKTLSMKSDEQKDKLFISLTRWFLKKKREILLNKAISQCQVLIDIFMNPYIDPLFSEMDSRPVFKHARRVTLDKQQRVLTLERKINCAWDKLEKSAKQSENLNSKWWKIPPTDNDHCLVKSPRSLRELSCQVALQEKFGNTLQVLQSSGFFNLFSAVFQFYHCILNSHIEIDEKDNLKFNLLPPNELNLTADEVNQLQKMLHHVNDFDIRTQARLLGARCLVLLKLCSGENLSCDQIKSVEAWKRNLTEH